MTMTRKREGGLTPTTMQRTLVLDDIRYLPHYQKAGVFVGPGRNSVEYSATDLVAAGAVREFYPLWPRGYSSCAA